MNAQAAWDQMESIRRSRWQQSVGTPDPLLEAAAAEIERLRLTAVEREALEFVVAEGRVACEHEADILRSMLARLA